jgi:hypothetical protein
MQFHDQALVFGGVGVQRMTHNRGEQEILVVLRFEQMEEGHGVEHAFARQLWVALAAEVGHALSHVLVP